MKTYFNKLEPEFSYPISVHLKVMKAKNLKEIIVYETKPIYRCNSFFCKAVGGVFEKGEGYEPCGKSCKLYEPRNKKSGCCIHRGYCYEEGDEYILNINGKLKGV